MSLQFEAIDFDAYHCQILPAQLKDGRGARAAAAAQELGPIAFRIANGDAYTYRPADRGIDIVPGDEFAATVVELEHRYWQGLVHDLESAPGLLYGGFARGLRGDMMSFVRWEPALRAIYCGRPIYDPENVELVGRNGARLAPTQTFLQSDADEDMAHFLAAAGYVLIREVFAPDEVAEMVADSEALRANAIEGDDKSWWGRGADGEPLLCRVLNAGDRPRLAALYDDPRILRLSRLPAEELAPRYRDETNGVTVLWKQPGVVEGLGDLPWHRDCGMGGHAVMCPAVNCSIYLGPANPEAGDLRFLPGSWQTSVKFADGDDPAAPAGISIDARPGDVSLHYGDVFHAAPPPRSTVGPFRTSVLIGWARPDAGHHRGEAHYNDALFQDDGVRVPNMREIARKS